MPGSEAQAPPVLNVRRPNTSRAEIERPRARPQTDSLRFDEAAQPRTALRLPDLAAVVKRMRRPEFNLAAIAQWGALALGGLFALWLIFGGRGAPISAVEEAPPWSPPGGTQVEMAPPAHAASPGAMAPQWQTGSREPAAAAPRPENQPPRPSGQNMPQTPDWNDPGWDDSVNRAAPPSTAAPRQDVRTAWRNEPSAGPPPAGPPTSQAQPLNVTVPVPQ